MKKKLSRWLARWLDLPPEAAPPRDDAAFRTLEQTLEQALDAVVTIDASNHVIFYNVAAERVWGYPRADVLGRNVSKLVPLALRAGPAAWIVANRAG